MFKKLMLAGVLACGVGIMGINAYGTDNANGKDAAKKGDKAHPAKVAQDTCPVEGKPIAADKKVFVDVEGLRIYLCCPECADKVKADAKKYIKELKDKNIELEKAPKAEKPPKADKAPKGDKAANGVK